METVPRKSVSRLGLLYHLMAGCFVKSKAVILAVAAFAMLAKKPSFPKKFALRVKKRKSNEHRDKEETKVTKR